MGKKSLSKLQTEDRYQVLDRLFIENGVTELKSLASLSGFALTTLKKLQASRNWIDRRNKFLANTFENTLPTFGELANLLVKKLKESVEEVSLDDPAEISTILERVMRSAKSSAELSKYNGVKLAHFALQELIDTVNTDDYFTDSRELILDGIAYHQQKKAHEAAEFIENHT